VPATIAYSHLKLISLCKSQQVGAGSLWVAWKSTRAFYAAADALAPCVHVAIE